MASKPGDRHLLIQMAEQCLKDNENWFPIQAHDLVHHTLALCGEAGELANIVKKIDRGTLDPEGEIAKMELAEELTDVLIYVLSIAGMLKVDLLKAYFHKRNTNVRRFSAHGQERVDGVRATVQ